MKAPSQHVCITSVVGEVSRLEALLRIGSGPETLFYKRVAVTVWHDPGPQRQKK